MRFRQGFRQGNVSLVPELAHDPIDPDSWSGEAI